MRRSALAAVLPLVAGCGGGNTEPPQTISGTYSLRSINDHSLPYHYSTADSSFQVTFTGGEFHFREDRTCDESSTFIYLDTTRTTTRNCTYSRGGINVDISFGPGASAIGVLSDSAFYIPSVPSGSGGQSFSYMYIKQ